MKKTKQTVTAKDKYIKKKKEQPSGVDDLATHEENDMKKLIQAPKQQHIQVEIDSDDEDDQQEHNDNKNNPDEQSRFVLGLIQKNRVNEKNSFEVPLIDIKTLSAFNQTQECEAWKHISATLDAGSKIYGFRVDLVHQNTFKVLGGLHRTQANDNQTNEEQKEIEQEQLRKKKLQNTGGENTLEKNPANLDTNKYDLEFEIDPLFQQTSAKFDEQGAKGLLMNNLTINENLMLALDSEILDIKPSIASINIEEFKQQLKNITSMKLCPELTQFKEELQIRGRNILDNDGQQQQLRTQQQQMNVEDYNYELNHHYDEDQYIDDIEQQSQSQQLHVQGNPHTQKINLHNMEQAISHIGTGRVFDNEREQLDWMKLDMNQMAKKNKNIIKPKIQKNNKKRNVLGFTFDDSDDEEIDRNILQANNKEKYITKPDYDFSLKGLLPRSYQIDKAELCQPFQIAALPDWGQDNNNNNNNDQLIEEPEYFDDNNEFPQQTQLSQFPKFLNNKLNIPIKQLKQKMWSQLENVIPTTQQKFGLEFNQIHSQLPNILNLQLGKGSVSIQTSFVTLLHLANEEHLKFAQSQNEDDFQIYREINT